MALIISSTCSWSACPRIKLTISVQYKIAYLCSRLSGRDTLEYFRIMLLLIAKSRTSGMNSPLSWKQLATTSLTKDNISPSETVLLIVMSISFQHSVVIFSYCVFIIESIALIEMRLFFVSTILAIVAVLLFILI